MSGIKRQKQLAREKFERQEQRRTELATKRRGRQRVIKNKRKNVHAFICGTLSDELVNESGMDPIIYNPYKFERFFNGERYVDTAEKVFIVGRKVYAANAQ
jgi:hypothetical protein